MIGSSGADTTAMAYRHNAPGRLSTVTHPGSLAVGYTYDQSGLRTKTTLPDGKIITSTYDAAGRLEGVTDWQSRTTAYFYDSGDRLTGIYYSNSTWASYGYDENNRTTYITNTSSVSGTLSSLSYSYDNAGSRTGVSEYLPGTGQPTANLQFDYDSIYRLKETRYPSNTWTYQYDPAGNRTVLTDTGQVTSYTYDSGDRMTAVGGGSVTWDANGNMLTKGGVTYQYDAANRLTSVVSPTLVATFKYNHDGLRTSMTVNGQRTDYVWDIGAGLPTLLTDTTSIYVSGFARQTGSDVEYYHTDVLGSVRNLTNGSGQNVGAYTYKPFGELLPGSATSSNPLRYTGQLADPPTGLYYLRARYYEPSTGRFINPDTATSSAGKPQELNRYAYAQNSPVVYTDPTGHIIERPECIPPFPPEDTSFRWPLSDESAGSVSQWYGYTDFAASGAYSGRPHGGLDIGVAEGTPVVATRDRAI